MLRNVVRIDPEKCTGCGACAAACEEGAIRMVGGKAVVADESCCDGLGACLPACPAGAISIEQREAAPFAVPMVADARGGGPRRIEGLALSQWPIQLRLVPAGAPFFDGKELLVAADCTAYAMPGFQERFEKGRAVAVGCPKLDPPDCWQKLADIIGGHDIRKIVVTRMTVPCCGGIVRAVKDAVRASGKDTEIEIVTIGPDGKVSV